MSEGLRNIRRLTDDELEARYAELSLFTENVLRDNRNTKLRAADYSKTVTGVEALTVPLEGITSFPDFGKVYEKIKSRFPNAVVGFEAAPAGGSYVNVDLPAYERVTENSSSGGSYTDYTRRPSDLKAMFIVMMEVILGTLLYLKWTGA